MKLNTLVLQRSDLQKWLKHLQSARLELSCLSRDTSWSPSFAGNLDERGFNVLATLLSHGHQRLGLEDACGQVVASWADLEPAKGDGESRSPARFGPRSSQDPGSVKGLLEIHRLLVGLAKQAAGFRRKDAIVRCKYSNAIVYRAPPSAFLPALVDDWLTFCRTTEVPALAQAALAMLQLLLIHPFDDGNGRTARAVFVQICRARGFQHPAGPLAIAGLYRFGATALWAGSVSYTNSGSIATFWTNCLRSIELSVAPLQIWRERVAEIKTGDGNNSDKKTQLVRATEALWMSVGGQLPP